MRALAQIKQLKLAKSLENWRADLANACSGSEPKTIVFDALRDPHARKLPEVLDSVVKAVRDGRSGYARAATMLPDQQLAHALLREQLEKASLDGLAPWILPFAEISGARGRAYLASRFQELGDHGTSHFELRLALAAALLGVRSNSEDAAYFVAAGLRQRKTARKQEAARYLRSGWALGVTDEARRVLLPVLRSVLTGGDDELFFVLAEILASIWPDRSKPILGEC